MYISCANSNNICTSRGRSAICILCVYILPTGIDANRNTCTYSPLCAWLDAQYAYNVLPGLITQFAYLDKRRSCVRMFTDSVRIKYLVSCLEYGLAA